MTTVPYPQVIEELLHVLGCPIDLDGCHQAMRMIRSQEAVRIEIKRGQFAGCYNNREINRQIAKPVLQQYPQLKSLIARFRAEASDFSTLAAWLNDFVEDVAYLSGNRPLPTSFGTFVKDISHNRQGGTIFFGQGGYTVRTRDSKQSWTYPTAFAMVLDGWRVD